MRDQTSCFKDSREMRGMKGMKGKEVLKRARTVGKETQKTLAILKIQ